MLGFNFDGRESRWQRAGRQHRVERQRHVGGIEVAHFGGADAGCAYGNPSAAVIQLVQVDQFLELLQKSRMRRFYFRKFLHCSAESHHVAFVRQSHQLL